MVHHVAQGLRSVLYQICIKAPAHRILSDFQQGEQVLQVIYQNGRLHIAAVASRQRIAYVQFLRCLGHGAVHGAVLFHHLQVVQASQNEFMPRELLLFIHGKQSFRRRSLRQDSLIGGQHHHHLRRCRPGSNHHAHGQPVLSRRNQPHFRVENSHGIQIHELLQVHVLVPHDIPHASQNPNHLVIALGGPLSLFEPLPVVLTVLDLPDFIPKIPYLIQVTVEFLDKIRHPLRFFRQHLQLVDSSGNLHPALLQLGEFLRVILEIPVFKRLRPHRALDAEIPDVVLQVPDGLPLQPGEAALQQRHHRRRPVPAAADFQKVHYETHHLRIPNASPGVPEQRQSVLPKGAFHDGLHLLRVVADDDDILHAVSPVQQVVHLNRRIFRLVVQVGAFHHLKIRRTEIRRGDFNFIRLGKKTLFDALQGFRLLQHVAGQGFHGNRQALLFGGTADAPNQHIFQSEIRLIHHDIYVPGHSGNLRQGADELRRHAVESVDPHRFSRQFPGFPDGVRVQVHVILHILVLSLHQGFVLLQNAGELPDFLPQQFVGFRIRQNFLQFFSGAFLLAEIRDEIVDHLHEIPLAGGGAKNIQLFFPIANNPRQKHVPLIPVQHPHVIRALLLQHAQAQPVHAENLHIQQTGGVQVFQSLFLRHQGVLIGHDHQGLPFGMLIDEFFLVDVLSALIDLQHVLLLYPFLRVAFSRSASARPPVFPPGTSAGSPILLARSRRYHGSSPPECCPRRRCCSSRYRTSCPPA